LIPDSSSLRLVSCQLLLLPIKGDDHGAILPQLFQESLAAFLMSSSTSLVLKLVSSMSTTPKGFASVEKAIFCST
jgi:hypothetical protein